MFLVRTLYRIRLFHLLDDSAVETATCESKSPSADSEIKGVFKRRLVLVLSSTLFLVTNSVFKFYFCEI